MPLVQRGAPALLSPAARPCSIAKGIYWDLGGDPKCRVALSELIIMHLQGHSIPRGLSRWRPLARAADVTCAHFLALLVVPLNPEVAGRPGCGTAGVKQAPPASAPPPAGRPSPTPALVSIWALPSTSIPPPPFLFPKWTLPQSSRAVRVGQDQCQMRGGSALEMPTVP